MPLHPLYEFDLIVIGSGIAGLTAALAAADEGRSVAVVTKEPLLEECNTRYAQGGIVAVGEGDSPALLTQDITVAGDGLNCREAVELLAAEGPALVDDLFGAPARCAIHARQGRSPRTHA